MRAGSSHFGSGSKPKVMHLYGGFTFRVKRIA